MWSCNCSLKVSIGCRMVFRSGGAFKSLPNIPLTGFLAVSQVDSAIFGVMVSCFPPFADSFSFQLSFFTTGWCTYLRTTTHRDNFAIHLRAMVTWYYPISLSRQSLVATFSIRSIPCRWFSLIWYKQEVCLGGLGSLQQLVDSHIHEVWYVPQPFRPADKSIFVVDGLIAQSHCQNLAHVGHVHFFGWTFSTYETKT